ncbi:MAG: glycosyltransferase [Deltaproteobacteria bacterium]|nr:glycosyltransferase [Deltaproteobacteria bacterium]
MVKKGVEIEIICPHENGCRFFEELEGIKIRRFPYFFPLKYQNLAYGSGILKNIKSKICTKIQLPFFIISEIIYTLRRLMVSKPELVHAHWALPQGLTGIICKKVLGVPYITTVHGSDVHGLQYPLLKALNRIVINNSDICTANSKASARKVYNIAGIEDTQVIPMGVDTKLFSRSEKVDIIRKKYEIDGDVLLFVGRLIRWKGVYYLVKALPEILKRYPKTKLLIVGSGPEKRRLIQLSAELEIKNRIVFIDEVLQEDLIPLYSIANILILPSIMDITGETEGLGVVLLEAMACRVPVIGSDVGGIKDIIIDGETGLLSEQKNPDSLAEKIISLLSDEQLRKKVIENGFKLVKEKFTWEAISDRFLNIYMEVIKKSNDKLKIH